MKENCNNMNQYFKKDPNAFYINEKGEWRCRSVHFEDQFRFNKARLKSNIQI